MICEFSVCHQKIEILFLVIAKYKNRTKKDTTMAYYKNEGYLSESDMKRLGMCEADKAAQRELNWDIRLEHYAKSSDVLKNCVKFQNMVNKWADSFDFPSPGVPTMKMLYILKLARENGILSDTICEFARAEEELLEKRPGFVSPAAVPFNKEKRNKNCIAALKARVEKREKKAAAVLARAVGKVAAAKKRAADESVWQESVKRCRAVIEQKTASARKAMGVRKNEPNPASICAMISQWEFEMNLELYAARLSK